MNRLLAGASRLLLMVLALLLGWLTPVHASGPSRSVAGDPVATAPAAEIAPFVQVFLVAYRGQGPPEVLGFVSARLMPFAGVAARPARAFYFVVVDSWPLEGVRNRAYDPALGRWLSRDPAGEGVDTNLYRYIMNNPLSDTDPFGLWPPGYDNEGQWTDAMANAGHGGWYRFANRFGNSVSAIGNAMGSAVGLTDYDSELQRNANPLARAGCQGGAVKYGTYGAVGVAVTAVVAAGGIGAWEFFAAGNTSTTLGIKGGEIVLTGGRMSRPFMRINPFGSLSAKQWLRGRLPHWHWRSPNGPAGPGGGIGRHLPWEW